MGFRVGAAGHQPEEILRHSGTVVVANNALLVFDPAREIRLPEIAAPERIIVLLSTCPHSGTVRAVSHVRQWAAERHPAVPVLVLAPLAAAPKGGPASGPPMVHAGTGEVARIGNYAIDGYATSHRNAGRGYVVRFDNSTSGASARPPLLVYTGATRPCYATVTAAEGAAVMIHDASYDETDGRAAGTAGCATAGQAAVVARAAGVQHLVLVSLRGVTAEGRIALQREATRLFGGASFESGTLNFRLAEGEIEQV